MQANRRFYVRMACFSFDIFCLFLPFVFRFIGIYQLPNWPGNSFHGFFVIMMACIRKHHHHFLILRKTSLSPMDSGWRKTVRLELFLRLTLLRTAKINAIHGQLHCISMLKSVESASVRPVNRDILRTYHGRPLPNLGQGAET